MKIRVTADADELALQAAAWIGEQARTAIAEREIFSLALSGGRGPHGLFEALAREKIDWRRVHLFQVDERAAPLESPERNFRAIVSLLVDRVSIPCEQLYPMPVAGKDLEAGAADYAATLERVLGAGRVLDLVHLGLGEDGHTASLLPGDPACESGAPVIVSREHEGFRRLSLNYQLLSGARQRCWFVTGAAKSEVLMRALDGDPGIPAGRIERQGTWFFVDQAAGALLEQ
ncbi:MAG TPA: 6-phosphogluconolactonase [Woeseiaceae bacterium]|nr:6-phosphogluconolactonase [Woeseiaceae bacterium]